MADPLTEEFREAVAGSSVPQIRRATAAFWAAHEDEPGRLYAALVDLWPDEDRAVRVGVAITMGPLATGTTEAEAFCTDVVATDADWRVQEALAKGLEWRCALVGWQAAEQPLERWLRHHHPNVRRAAAEGPRVWTRRDHFRDHPDRALWLLGLARADTSAYVRTSVANAVSDISRTHPDEALSALSTWAGDPGAARVVRTACRHLVKTHAEQSARVLAIARD